MIPKLGVLTKIIAGLLVLCGALAAALLLRVFWR